MPVYLSSRKRSHMRVRDCLERSSRAPCSHDAKAAFRVSIWAGVRYLTESGTWKILAALGALTGSCKPRLRSSSQADAASWDNVFGSI